MAQILNLSSTASCVKRSINQLTGKLNCLQCLVKEKKKLKINKLNYFFFFFFLKAETLVDKAVSLEFVGGTYGGMRKPSKFICLILKML